MAYFHTLSKESIKNGFCDYGYGRPRESVRGVLKIEYNPRPLEKHDILEVAKSSLTFSYKMPKENGDCCLLKVVFSIASLLPSFSSSPSYFVLFTIFEVELNLKFLVIDQDQDHMINHV